MTVINAAERQKVEDFFLKEIANNLPNNIYKYHFQVIDTAPVVICEEPRTYLDPEPFKGKIIAYKKSYMLVKFGLNQFRAVALKFVNSKPPIGSKVEVIPYQRFNFSGRCVGSIIRKMAEGNSKKIKQISFDRRAHLPILSSSIKTSSMQMMISMFNRTFNPDISFRTVSEILVDANPTEFSFNNPNKQELSEILPEIRIKVCTKKFDGYVIFSCMGSGKKFNFKAFTDKKVVTQVTNLRLGQLTRLLIDCIDDRCWQKTVINVLEN